MPLLGEVLDAVDTCFDPRWSAAWDAVGLVCGDRSEPVERILLAIDPVPAVIEQAIATQSQLLITHHPLLLSGVHGVPADDPKGAMIHRMIREHIAHYVVHTNADVADPGVSDALARCIGLRDTHPLEPSAGDALDKLVVFVPTEASSLVLDALATAGAGHIGDYDRCAWMTSGTGTFRPSPGAHPAIGQVGEVAVVAETRLELVVPRSARARVLAELMNVHPYEQPAFDLLPMAELPGCRGTGRVGHLLQPLRLVELLDQIARSLPATKWGVRAAGAADQLIRSVAVCGGSGGSLIEAARAAGADAYLTADLKHHTAVEAVTERGPGLALIDAAHWATEWPWLEDLALRLRARFGTTVDVVVSTQVTDPWSLHVPSIESSPNRQ